MDARIVRRGPHPIVRRRLQVREVVDITRRYRRVVLAGPELEGFRSDAPDDHVKLIFPDGSMRDFTPRAYDAKKRELTIDFALHGAGVANAWAANAKKGDSLTVGGPRGSMVVTYDFAWYLLAGDETAIPAIARRLEELPAGANVRVLLEVEAKEDEQPIPNVTWVRRADGESLAQAVRAAALPEGDGFVFVAAESAAVRAIRGYLSERPHGLVPIARAYWKKGEIAFHE